MMMALLPVQDRIVLIIQVSHYHWICIAKKSKDSQPFIHLDPVTLKVYDFIKQIFGF